MTAEQNAAFQAYAQVGLEALTPSRSATARAFENTGLEIPTPSRSATARAFENTGLEDFARAETIVRSSPRWGVSPVVPGSFVRLRNSDPAETFGVNLVTPTVVSSAATSATSQSINHGSGPVGDVLFSAFMVGTTPYTSQFTNPVGMTQVGDARANDTFPTTSFGGRVFMHTLGSSPPTSLTFNLGTGSRSVIGHALLRYCVYSGQMEYGVTVASTPLFTVPNSLTFNAGEIAILVLWDRHSIIAGSVGVPAGWTNLGGSQDSLGNALSMRLCSWTATADGQNAPGSQVGTASSQEYLAGAVYKFIRPPA